MGYHEEQIPLNDPHRLPTLFITFNANLFSERERIGDTRRAISKLIACLRRSMAASARSHSNRVDIHKCYYILVATAIWSSR